MGVCLFGSVGYIIYRVHILHGFQNVRDIWIHHHHFNHILSVGGSLHAYWIPSIWTIPDLAGGLLLFASDVCRLRKGPDPTGLARRLPAQTMQFLPS